MALKTISVLLKMLQIVSLSAAICVVGYFVKKYHHFKTRHDPKIDPYDVGEFGRYEFFLYSAIVGVSLTVLGLMFLYTGLQEKISGSIAIALLQFYCTVQLLVSTALLAKVVATYEEDFIPSKSHCDIWDDADRDFRCSHVIGGVVCGFLGTLLFALDCSVSFVLYIQSFNEYTMRI